MTVRGWMPVVLVMLASHTASASTEPVVHVLEDRVDGGNRTLTFVLERAGDCVDPAEVTIEPAFHVVDVQPCAITVSGSAAELPALVVGGRTRAIASEPARAQVAPVVPVKITDSLAISVLPASILPVGRTAIAAYLVVTEHGRPTDEAELNIHAEGAKVRALRWERLGIAAVDVEVVSWTSDITLVVDTEAGGPQRVTIPVDPGPPHRAEIVAPSMQAGTAVEITARVMTRAGVDVPADRIRVTASGCERVEHQVVCSRAGATMVVALVEHRGIWVPIGHVVLTVDAAPMPPPPPPPPIVAPVLPREGLSWSGALSGALPLAGQLHLALSARLERPIRETALRGWASAGAHLVSMTIEHRAPVVDDLGIGEQWLAVDAGVAMRVGRRPYELRVGGGPTFVRQRATLADEANTSYGVRVRAFATAGTAVPFAGRHFGVALGLGRSLELSALVWATPSTDLFLEVSL